MNEIEFRNWMKKNGSNPKVTGDCISRLKRIERELDRCDIDKEYHSDRCSLLLSVFENMGQNEAIKKFPNANLPSGKYYMNTYRYALRKYIDFCDQVTSRQQ